MIKAGLGANPIEKRAIDAYLERLQVEIDPATREIRSAGKVMGGMEALSKLASATGELTLKELAQVEQSRGGYEAVRNHVARMRGRDDETVARATLKGAQASLQAAGDALATLVRTTEQEDTFMPLDRVARRINHAASSVREALSKASLSYASDTDLTEIRAAWSGFLHQVGQHLGSMKSMTKIFGGVAEAVIEDHNSRTLGRFLTGGVASGMAELGERLHDAYDSIAWLTDNFNLFDVRSATGLREAEKGTIDQKLIGLAELGHGLIAEHPTKADFARHAYELITSFNFPNSSRESSYKREQVFERAVGSAFFTLQRMFDDERHVAPENQRWSLLGHLKDSLDFSVQYHKGNVALDASRLDYLMYAKRADCIGEPEIAARIRQMSDALWNVEPSPRTGSRAGVNHSATRMFTASMQSWVDPNPVFSDLPPSYVPQHAAAADHLREELRSNVGFDGYAPDLRESHIDSTILGALVLLSLDRPDAAHELRTQYAAIAGKPTEEFIASARELTEKIIVALESYSTDKGTATHNRRIDGVHYAVLHQNDGTDVLDVRVKIQRQGDKIIFPEIAGRPTLDAAKLRELEYHVTTDGWTTLSDLKPSTISEHWVQYHLPISGDAKIDGLFHHWGVEWIKHHGKDFSGYEVKTPSAV